jgi:NADH-quinone oxidoreductase subunit K
MERPTLTSAAATTIIKNTNNCPSTPAPLGAAVNMPIQYYITLSIVLFCIGIVGVLTRRNAIIIFMCIELMLNAVNLLLVAFSKMHNAGAVGSNANPTAGVDGQLFVFFIMVVAAAEVSVGLSIIVMMYRNTHSVDVNFLNRLKN